MGDGVAVNQTDMLVQDFITLGIHGPAKDIPQKLDAASVQRSARDPLRMRVGLHAANNIRRIAGVGPDDDLAVPRHDIRLQNRQELREARLH